MPFILSYEVLLKKMRFQRIRLQLFWWQFFMLLWNLSSSQDVSIPEVRFAKEVFAVGYSPYVKNYFKPSGSDEEEAPSWDRENYNYQDVMEQVKLSANKFGTLVTFGMGTTNATHRWDASQAIGLTALAAATVNQNADKLLIKVIQGVYQIDDKQTEKNELRNAFKVAKYANAIFNGTVTGISLFNLFNLNEESKEKLLDAYEEYRNNASELHLKLGTRIHKCDSVLDEKNPRTEHIKIIAEASDFILCSIFPEPEEVHRGPKYAVEQIGERFLASMKILREVNPKLEMHNGETGWPSRGPSYNLGNATSNTINNSLAFWTEMNLWAIRHNITVVIFEAFDEPWKSDPKKKDPTKPDGKYGAEGHYGWFTFNGVGNNGTYVEKYLDPEQYKEENPQVVNDSQESYSKNKGDDYSSSSYTTEITTTAVVLLIFLAMFQLIVTLYRQDKDKRKKNSVLSQEEIDEFIQGTSHRQTDEFEELSYEEALSFPYKMEFEIAKDDLKIESDKVLGTGHFGIVYRGGLEGQDKTFAFKTIKTNDYDNRLPALRGMLAEIKIMSHIGEHDSVVKFVGAYTADIDKGVVYVCVEYCPMGSMDKYLRNNKEQLVKDICGDNPNYENLSDSSTTLSAGFQRLCKWSLEIAQGMAFLASKKVIHADLATRNVLLGANLSAKITDFGLSCRMYEYTEYVKSTQELLPWRWMALESLKKMNFSHQSDVWSFGVTLYEIFSLGEIPYPGIGWDVNFVSQLEQGLRMTNPRFVDDNIYQKMLECWSNEAKNRPRFAQLVEFFNSMLNNGGEYQDIKAKIIETKNKVITNLEKDKIITTDDEIQESKL